MKFDRILIDVDTQRDFLTVGAALPVTNGPDMLAALRRVMQWARATGVPVISSLDSHRDNEPRNGTPAHCLEGSTGHKKLPFTLMRHRLMVENDATLALRSDLLGTYDQLIFRKRSKDFFNNPKADRLLTGLNAGEIIVCGVGLESSIRTLVLGLLARHKCVALVPEACGSWNRVDGELATRLMGAKGARIVTVEELTATNGVAHSHAAGRNGRNGRHRTSRQR